MDHGSSYYDEIVTQTNINEELSHSKSTDTSQECFAYKDKKTSIHEENDSIITTINSTQLPNSFGCEESQNQNNSDLNYVINSTNNILSKQELNVTEIVDHGKCTNSDYELAQDLKIWAVKRNITLTALSDLLKILKKYNYKLLPMCAQTLLKTPRDTKSLIREFKGDGEFWYYGILSGLKTVLSKEILETMSDVIEIDVFFDGFSPYNSIRRNLWPIAGCIASRNEVFIIAIWCGETKCPSNLDNYLEDFINESLKLMNGFNIEDKYYKLKVRNIIADAPARAWLKCVNQHGNKFACERCTIKGVWFGNRITYPPHEEAPLWTDESFCQQTHKEYHKGVSPLITRLQLKPLTQFPLESFHLLYLGIMKRILSMLYCAKASRYKLPRDVVFKIDSFSNFLKSFFPSDFARKPRRLSDWKYYKGTEYRRLLLYDGFLIFRFMPREVYENFLLFACAIRILVDPVLVKDYAVDADKLLKLFVKHSSKIYGQTFVVYNVHHLIHIVADCELHGHLEEFSAFKYESFLGHMKDFLHAPGKTLSQIVCRVIEKAAKLRFSYFTKIQLLFEKCHNNGPTLNCRGEQYNKIRTPDKKFCLKSADAYCLTKNNEILKIENIIKCNDGTYLIGRKFEIKSDLFSYPFPSSCINIYIVSNLGSLHRWCLDDIKKKVVLLPLPEKDRDDNWIVSKNVCFPMPHSEIL
ncbi:hypothetical protein ALC62_10742 [Cyphomyrmex costatus]|uniref:Transposase domain-containing protein n=1 Tax=Cyphomyrmex costatus TaxID=456900 RepID=A0A151IDJ9_9HYME|nr:hypothetical protein ALC62_10742 [Cyphomyrmex costatus]